jgi:hypothetical protein
MFETPRMPGIGKKRQMSLYGDLELDLQLLQLINA